MDGTELEVHQPYLIPSQNNEETDISPRVKLEWMLTLTLGMDASTARLNLVGLAPQKME